MDINKDAWSLQFIFDESLKIMDQLQQMYDTIMQDTQEDNEKFFAFKIIKHALLNAMMYWRFLENTVRECESMIVMRFPKPEPLEIHLRNEMSIRFFLLFFLEERKGEYHSRIRDLMRLMSEWILKAEELLQEGYILLEKDKVWTRREKDDDWIMMENDEDFTMLGYDSFHHT